MDTEDLSYTTEININLHKDKEKLIVKQIIIDEPSAHDKNVNQL